MQIAYLVVLYALAIAQLWFLDSQHKYPPMYLAGFGLMYLLAIPLIVYRKTCLRWGLVCPTIWLVIATLMGCLVWSQPAPEGVVLTLAAAWNGVLGIHQHLLGQDPNEG